MMNFDASNYDMLYSKPPRACIKKCDQFVTDP